MAHVSDEMLFDILRLLAQHDPAPFYPMDRPADLHRDVLDHALDRLRLAGLIQLTEWTRDKGQGTRLTEFGRGVLSDPRLLHRPPPKPAAPQRTDDAAWSHGEAIRRAFMSPDHGIVVRLLLGVSIASFVVSLVTAIAAGGSAEGFLFKGRIGGPVIEFGVLNAFEVIRLNEWWRLFTYGFLHAGLLHIAFNMSALWSLGRLLENVWGRIRFAVLYFFAMAAGGCMVLLLQPDTAVLGASGAIFGLFPSLAVVAWLNRDQLPEAWKANIRQTLLINGILGVLMSTMPGISWTCHLGGALGGLVISIPLHLTQVGRPLTRMLAWLSMPFLFATMILGVWIRYRGI